MNRKIKVRVDWNFIDKEWCDIPFLFPVLDVEKFKSGFYYEEQVEEWCSVGDQMVEREINLINADFVVFPKNYNLWYLKDLKNLCKIAKKYNKKVMVFYMSDIENKLPYIDNLIVFRTSLTNKNPDNEYPIPWFPEDLMKYDKNPYKNINTTIPTIWYAWYCIKNKIRYFISKILMKIVWFKPINLLIYLFFNYIYHNEKLYNIVSVIGTWFVYRKDAIDILLKNKQVKFNYMRRERTFWIHEKSNYRNEYIDNIINSDFPLVIRWFWNFSFRLSEVISLWKIPLFIDTDCKLPFDNEIDYKDLFIWVPYKDIKNIQKYISKYLKNNKNKFIENQKQIRYIYENYFTMTGYYTKIIYLLFNKIWL